MPARRPLRRRAGHPGVDAGGGGRELELAVAADLVEAAAGWGVLPTRLSSSLRKFIEGNGWAMPKRLSGK